jgi:hypothetical protein
MRGETIRRGVAAALPAAAVAAASGLATAPEAHAGAMPYDLFGDATPDTLGLTDVYVMIRSTELNGGGVALGAWQASDAPAGLETLIDLPNRGALFEIDPATVQVGFAGVYDGGGVAVLLPDGSYTPGDDWTDLFNESEANVQNWLETDQTGQLQSWFNNEIAIAGLGNDPGVRGDIVNFTTARVNGSGVVDYRIVPTPGALALLGGVAPLALRRRR